MKTRLFLAGKKVLVALAVMYLAGMTFTCSVQDRLLYPGAFGEGDVSVRPDLGNSGGEWLERPLESGERVEAIFLTSKRSGDEMKPLVVYLHGNGGRVEWTRAQVQVWRELGYHVLIPEYRGYGRCGGEPGAGAIVGDVEWFIDEVLRHRGDVDRARILYHGYSLGGAIAGELARRRTPWMMVLRSTFSSMGSMANRRGFPGFLARDPYDTAEVVGAGDFPVLITHGTQDEVIPVEESEVLAGAAGARGTREVFACGHSVCPSEERYAEVVTRWHLEQVGGE